MLREKQLKTVTLRLRISINIDLKKMLHELDTLFLQVLSTPEFSARNFRTLCTKTTINRYHYCTVAQHKITETDQ